MLIVFCLCDFSLSGDWNPTTSTTTNDFKIRPFVLFYIKKKSDKLKTLSISLATTISVVFQKSHYKVI